VKVAEHYFRPLRKGLFLSINGKDDLSKARFIRGSNENPGGWLPSKNFAASDHVQNMHLDVNLFPHGKTPVVFTDAVKELLEGKQLTIEWLKDMNTKHRQRFYDGDESEMTCGFEPLSVEKLVNWMNTFHPGWQAKQKPSNLSQLDLTKGKLSTIQNRNQKRTFQTDEGVKTWDEMISRYSRGSSIAQIKADMKEQIIAKQEEPELKLLEWKPEESVQQKSKIRIGEGPVLTERVEENPIPMIWNYKTRERNPEIIEVPTAPIVPVAPVVNVKLKLSKKLLPSLFKEQPPINIYNNMPEIKFPDINIAPAAVNVTSAPVNIAPAAVNVTSPAVNVNPNLYFPSDGPGRSAPPSDATIAASQIVNEENTRVLQQKWQEEKALLVAEKERVQQSYMEAKQERITATAQLDLFKKEMEGKKVIDEEKFKLERERIMQKHKLKIETLDNIHKEALKTALESKKKDYDYDLEIQLKTQKDELLAKFNEEKETMTLTKQNTIDTLTTQLVALQTQNTLLLDDPEKKFVVSQIKTLEDRIVEINKTHLIALKDKEDLLQTQQESIRSQLNQTHAEHILHLKTLWEGETKVALDNLKNEYEAQKIIDQTFAKTEVDRMSKELLEVKRNEIGLLKTNQEMGVKLEKAETWVNNRVEEVQKQLEVTNQVALRAVEQNLKDKEDHIKEILAKQKNIPQEISDFFKGYYPSFDEQLRKRLRGDPTLDIKDISVVIRSQLNESRDESLEVFLKNFSFKLSPEQINDISKIFKDTWEVNLSQFLTQANTIFVEFQGTSQLNEERELNKKLVEQQKILDNTLKQKQEEITIKTQNIEAIQMVTAQITNSKLYDDLFGKKAIDLIASLSKNTLLKMNPVAMSPAYVKATIVLERNHQINLTTNKKTLMTEVANFLKTNNAGSGIPGIDGIIDSTVYRYGDHIATQFWDIVNVNLQVPVIKLWDEANRSKVQQIEEKAQVKIHQNEKIISQLKEDLVASEDLIQLGRSNYEEVGSRMIQEREELEEQIRVLQRAPLETTLERPPLETQPAPIERKQPSIHLVPQKKNKREQRVEGVDEKTGEILNPTRNQIIMQKAEKSVKEKLKRGRDEERKDPNSRPRQRSRSTSQPRVEKSFIDIQDKAEWIDNEGFKMESHKPINKMSQEELENILSEIQGAS
jgi:hypothetical protein